MEVDAERLALGREVAEHLGPEWTASYEELYGWKHVAQLSRQDGATLELHVGDDWQRVAVSGRYPGHGHFYDAPKGITVAVARGPQVIAREITARFLRPYLRLYERRVREQRQHEEFETARLEALEGLAVIAGEPVNDKSKEIYLSVPWLDGGDPNLSNRNVYGSVKLTSETYGSLHLEFAPVDLLAQVLTVIQEYKTSQPQGR